MRPAALATVVLLAALAATGCGDETSLPDPTRDSALIEAASAGRLADVERLLAAGASTTATDAEGRTALIAAAYGNHVDVARALLEAGADVNRQDATQQSAYLIAASEVGDDPRLLELTLRHGADVEAKDSYNGTGLIRAADRGHVEIVRRLLDTGIDVDHVNRLGWTALLEAVILGGGDVEHIEIVRVLVEEGGVDTSIRDHEGRAALDHARANGYAEMIAILQGDG